MKSFELYKCFLMLDIWLFFLIPFVATLDIQVPINPFVRFSEDMKQKMRSNLSKLTMTITSHAQDAISKHRRSSISSAMIDPSLLAELQTVIESGPVPKTQRKFLINGWRWHTASVLRDLDRFAAIAQNLSTNLPATVTESNNKEFKKYADEYYQQLVDCYGFVCNFNWKALIRVESEIFFPWLNSILPSSANDLIQDILAQHSVIQSFSKQILSTCEQVKLARTRDEILSNLSAVEHLIHDIRLCAVKIQNAQEMIFVPYVAAYINQDEQDVFNKKVLRKLGLLESQIHLVSMSDAIRNNPIEFELFKKQIPKFAQALIPVWRRTLYVPRARCLESVA